MNIFSAARTLTALLTLGLTAAGCGGGPATPVDTIPPEREETVTKDLPFTGGAFTLGNENGAVSVIGWDQPTVQIVGKKSMKISTAEGLFSGPSFETAAQADAHFAALAMNVQAASDKIVVETEYPKNNKNVTLSMEYQIKVPRGSSIEVTTENGAVRVEQVEKEVGIETGNGEVQALGILGDVQVETVNGAITVADCRKSIQAATDNGKITIGLPDQGDGDISAETANGAIELNLPAAAAFDLNAETSNGSISTGFTLAAGATQTEHKLEGKVGDGGRDVTLQTKNGNITVNPLTAAAP